MSQDNYLNLPRLNQFYNKLKTIFAMKSELVNLKGDKGDTGATGAQGISVTKVEQTTTSTADAGENIITVTLSNGDTSTFKVKNGSKGSAGMNATTTEVATTSANGLMSKDMVTRLNLCTSTIMQSSEPSTQKTGDIWDKEI